MKYRQLRSAVMAFGLLLATSNLAVAADVDGDGYDTVTPPIDCNDGNPSIYPGAVEIVGDSVDQNCDAHETCYVDQDDDIYRVGTTVLSGDSDCLDAGEARNTDPPGDCNDTNPSINPGAIEVCDSSNTDEDCDGEADDLDTAASGKTSWYADADDDGFGDPASSVLACDAPPDTVADATDCDDTRSHVNTAAGEQCDIEDRDEDCDGLADDLDPDATGETPWFVDSDADGYGDPSSVSVQACDQPASRAGNDDDCDDTDSDVNPGGTETCIGDDPKDYDCNGSSACDDSACASAPDCSGEVFDHMECFKVKTTEKLKATLDLNPGTNPPFQLAEGCTIGKAAKICVPIMRPAYEVDPSSSLTENPLYEGDAMQQESICYKVKCPKDSPPFPSQPSVELLDHFGARAFEKVKVSEICAPAEIVP